jgi:hypothetical protein
MLRCDVLYIIIINYIKESITSAAALPTSCPSLHLMNDETGLVFVLYLNYAYTCAVRMHVCVHACVCVRVCFRQGVN